MWNAYVLTMWQQKESKKCLRVHLIMCIAHDHWHMLPSFCCHMTHYVAKLFPYWKKKGESLTNWFFKLYQQINSRHGHKFSMMEKKRWKFFQPYQIWFLKATKEEKFAEDGIVNSYELAYVDKTNYWAQI